MQALTWIGTFFGVMGIIATIVAYRRSRVTAQPAYQTRSLRLIGVDNPALPQEVEVRFRGDSVPRLTSTRIVLWNAGRATIRRGDIVDSDYLRIEVDKDARILTANVIKTTRAVIGFETEIDNPPNKALLKFDYLDSGDGAVVEVLHTDKAGSKVAGSIVGVPQGVEDRGGIPVSISRTREYVTNGAS